MVRIYGNVAGTNLTYEPKPAGAPDTINAGEVVDGTGRVLGSHLVRS